MAEEAADTVAEENEPEETFAEEEAPASPPPPRSPGRSPARSPRGSQEVDDGPSGSGRPCGYRPKKRKVSYVWGPPKQSAMEPVYSPCPHIYFKNMRENIQRDGLSRDDWMDILSTPNPTPWVKKGPNGEKLIRYRRKPCSKRVKQLAIPRIALVRANWEEYKGILSDDMLERLRQILADDFHMTPEEIKEFIKRGKQQCRPKRRKKKKRRKSSIPVEMTEEEWVKSLLTEVADNATEIAEYEHPSAPSGRLEEMITTILERLAALAGEPPPPRNATGLVARLMIVIAEKLACWIESVVCEADSMPDETPCAQGLGLLSMLFCSPFCSTLKKMRALMPCCAEKKGHKRRHSKSTKQPKTTTCCAKIKEIIEEELAPPEPVRFPECKCACRCVQPRRRRRRGRKGKQKGRGKKKHGEEGEEDESYEEYEGEEGEGGGSGEEGEGEPGEGDDGDGDGGGGGGEDGGDDGGDGGGGGADDGGDGGGGADEGGGEEGGDEATDELKEGGSGGVGASKSSKESSNKSGQSKTSANAAGSKSSANAAGSKSSANAAGSKGSAGGGSKSATNAAASKSSANAGGGSKSATNAGASKSSANAGGGSGGGSKSATNAGASKSSANAGGGSGGGSKSATNAGASKSSANAGGSSKSSTNAAKSKSSADAAKSKSSVKASASKASSKSKTDDGATAYKVTSGEDGVLKVEAQEPIEEVTEEPPPAAEEEEAPADGAEAPEEEIEEGGLEAQLSEIGENLVQEAIDEGAANAADGNLPNVTFGSILRQLSQVIEDLPEGEQSERKEKLQHTLEKKFATLVEADDEPHSPEGMEEVVTNVADKVATWMDGVIREAESRLSAASGGGAADLRAVGIPGQVASKEVREWAEWIVGVMGVAEDWADWISSTVAAAEEKAREKKGESRTSDGAVKKLTKAEWDVWKQNVKKGAIEFRQRKQAIKETAQEWEKRTKGKKVIPSGQPATLSNEMQQEEEQKVTDMDGASEKSPTPDSPPTEE